MGGTSHHAPCCIVPEQFGAKYSHIRGRVLSARYFRVLDVLYGDFSVNCITSGTHYVQLDTRVPGVRPSTMTGEVTTPDTRESDQSRCNDGHRIKRRQAVDKTRQEGSTYQSCDVRHQSRVIVEVSIQLINLVDEKPLHGHFGRITSVECNGQMLGHALGEQHAQTSYAVGTS